MTVESFVARLTLRHLRALVAVADQASLLAAARELNLTQPTISKTLKEAEAIAGRPLFARTNRGAFPTPYGTALVRHARIVVAQLRNAYEEMVDLSDGTGGRVVAGTLLTGASHLLPDAIARLHRERPRVSVTIVDGTNDVLMPALRAGEIDCVVGRLPDYRERDGLRQESLFNDHACIVVRRGHPLARLKSPGLADLTDQRWILPRQQTTLRRQIDKDFRDAGGEAPAAVVDSVSPSANRRLLLNGDYVAIWPYEIARAEQARGEIEILAVPLPSTVGPVGISTRREGILSPAAQALIIALRETASASDFACRSSPGKASGRVRHVRPNRVRP